MGGGISLVESVEELMTTTYLIGKAISAISFPGMYRIYDFHSKNAPKIKQIQKISFFAPDSDEEDEEDEGNGFIDPSKYEHFFHVTVGNDIVYLENVEEMNEAGWTALHTCCMSYATVPAGISIIDELIRLGGQLDIKTKAGPGTFNKGWTPLHMACAYGIEPLVEKLVQSGANCNSINSFGYSCLLEACHRGFSNIVKFLLKSPVEPINLSYIPLEEEASQSPFSSAPSQSALAEASRCGFYKVVQTLMEAGAPKDLQNKLGWTALHEACFYNRMETVKTLLLNGANATIRTRQGALPYHFAGIMEIRTMLETMGGADAVPKEGDVIDMIMVLTELTSPESYSNRNDAAIAAQASSSVVSKTKSPVNKHKTHNHHVTTGSFQMEDEVSMGLDSKAAKESDLLHNGDILGQLPSLNKHSPGKGINNSIQHDLDIALSMENNNHGKLLSSPNNDNGNKNHNPSRKADDKKKRKKTKDVVDVIPSDMPRYFLCQLTEKPMSEPMKSIYGNIYDKTAIMTWFTQQGKICPLTGAPLSEIDLTPQIELGEEIRTWILARSMGKTNDNNKQSPYDESNSTSISAIKADMKSTPKTNENDDLYDF
eukprot:gene14703-19761_t